MKSSMVSSSMLYRLLPGIKALIEVSDSSLLIL